MIRSICKLVPLGVLFLLTLPTGAATQTLGPEALVDGFLRAFNAHDAKAFGSLFTEDADWVSVAGIRVKGRAGIAPLSSRTTRSGFTLATSSAISRDLRGQ